MEELRDNMTMILIDDIRSVTEGIATQIDWERHGITICGKAQNGEDGMRLIESCKPDIILTDIRMPKLDGIALTQRVKQLLPKSKVLLITGFTDFEYAQQALRLGALDIITKPFSLRQIEDAVLEAKQVLQDERQKSVKFEQMEQRIKQSMPVLRQEYFQLLIRHQADRDSSRNRLEFLQVDLEPEHLAVMVLEIDRFGDECKSFSIREIELTRYALQSIVEETILEHTKGVVFRESWNRFVAVFNVSEVIDISALGELCREHVNRFTRYTVSIGLGREVEHIHELSESYVGGLAALSFHFYTGGNGVFSFRDAMSTKRYLTLYSREEEQELSLAIRSGNKQRAVSLLESMFARLSILDPLPEPAKLVNICCELGFMMLRTLQEKLPLEEVATFEHKLQEVRSNTTSFAGLKAQIFDICVKGCERIESIYRNEAAQIIDQTVKYIRNNLHADLTVAHCAKRVHLSESYYANLFKKITGATFNQFVTQERIEQAKRLLIDGIPVQEVSELLGYLGRRYFSDLFRKHTGLTPSEFRQQYAGRAQEE
ncbi:response regulator [Paenibacillus contaminans]|uniref:DNA-binding response regulator n=1 Tax=Paenibacillus contaminans TaxID=450362 RepID=A0A329MPY1_9BACL|nr:response regulator [Paenibacillus contaminans]RAV20793.1 DNA-binding response regulator [Paenibacillus contaminans]